MKDRFSVVYNDKNLEIVESPRKGNCVEVVIASAAPQSFEGATRETHDTEEEKISETGIWFCLKSKQEGNRCKWVRIVRVK